jgi:hypothetical protein
MPSISGRYAIMDFFSSARREYRKRYRHANRRSGARALARANPESRHGDVPGFRVRAKAPAPE